jgi:hypothetical protein
MNKKLLTVVGLATVALGAVATFGVSQVAAYQGDYTQHGPNYSVEREASMEIVMDNKDYNGWVTLMTEGGRSAGVLRKIDSQEKFNLFVEAHDLAEEGKTDEANAIRTELGLGTGSRMGGQMRGSSARGQNNGGSFVDANGDGACDNM